MDLDNLNNNVFISILMSLYGDNISSLILRKKIENELMNIIHTLIKKYSINNETSANFFNIITPEIILLKFLKLTNDEDKRKYILDNRTYKNIQLNYISRIFNNLNINNVNFIKSNYDDNFYFDERRIKDERPEVVILEVDDNFNPDKEIKYLGDKTTFFENVLIIDSFKYNLDTVIIKSINTTNDYLILFQLNGIKKVYDITNSKFYDYDWILKEMDYKFKDQDGNEIIYKFDDIKHMIAIYLLIENPSEIKMV